MNQPKRIKEQAKVNSVIKVGAIAKAYIVLLRCTVTKRVVCEDCTLQQAFDAPWDHAISEVEIDQVDWGVLSVTE